MANFFDDPWTSRTRCLFNDNAAACALVRTGEQGAPIAAERLRQGGNRRAVHMLRLLPIPRPASVKPGHPDRLHVAYYEVGLRSDTISEATLRSFVLLS